MRNFVKVLLVGTVLAGACVLLPNDVWADVGSGEREAVKKALAKDEKTNTSKITGVSTTLKGWKNNIDALISDGTGGLEAGAAYEYTGGFFGNRNDPKNYKKIGDVKTNNIGQLVVRTKGQGADVYTMSRGNQITANKNITNAIHANNNAVTLDAATDHLKANKLVPDGATVSVSKNEVTVTHNGKTSVYTQEGGSYRDKSGNIVATTGASGGRPNIASANLMDGSVGAFVTNVQTTNEAITMALHNQYPNAEVKINAAGNGGTIQINGKAVPFSADVSSSSTGTRVRYTVNNNLKQDIPTPAEAGWQAFGNTLAAVPEALVEGLAGLAALGAIDGYAIGLEAVDKADPVILPLTGKAPTFVSDEVKREVAEELGVRKHNIGVNLDAEAPEVYRMEKNKGGTDTITPLEAIVAVTPKEDGSVAEVKVELTPKNEAAKEEVNNKEPVQPGGGMDVVGLERAAQAYFNPKPQGEPSVFIGLNHDNASAIGNLLGGDLGWSKNGYTMTSEQAGTLKDLYGITFDSANQQIRFSGNEGDFGADIMNYMNQLSSVNGRKGYQSLLQDHAQNTNQYRYRQYAIDAAQVKVDEAQAKVKKLIVTKGTQKEIQKAREELGEAQKALGKAREDGKGDIDKYNATITELDSIVTAAKKNYTIAKSAALSTAENFFGNDTARSNQFADAINSSDFETARSLAYDALSNKTISPDEFVELNNKIAAVEGTKAEADAKEAEVNQVQQGAETPREVDLQDLVRIGTVAMTPLVTKTELALRDDVNVLAGEIGAAVGAVDDTALSDVDVDASMPSTVSGSAMVVAELLKNANVDLKLLDETFEEEEEKTVVQTGTLAGAGSQAGTSASLEVPEEEKEEKPEDEKKYLTDEQVALIQAKRQMLLKQYVNAAVQISEGMNAVSNKFADRANVLISFSEGVQNEAGAFGLTQDVGRYILLESLRAVALSSAQMGVQAARLLNEREVDNEIQ